MISSRTRTAPPLLGVPRLRVPWLRAPRLRGLTLTALALTAPCTAQAFERQVIEALDRARPVLLNHLQNMHGGYLALGCLAALHDGIPPTDPSLARPLERLRRSNLQSTYDCAVRLMVLEEWVDAKDRLKLASRDTKALLSYRTGQGYGYGRGRSSGRWDLSNTQYAALGLRSAEAMGLRVPQSAWKRLATTMIRMQNADGGFGYTPDNGSTSSMTVAGIGVLELCMQYIRSGAPTEKMSQALRNAWQWMTDRRAQIGKPPGNWTHYFLYGLERAAVLSGKTRVGDVPWYEHGARFILSRQGTNGGFCKVAGQVADPATNAFGILFLRRKFKRIAGPVTGDDAFTVLNLSPRASKSQEGRAVEAAVRRGREAVPDVLRAMRSTVTTRRRAAAQALVRIAGQDFGYDPESDPESDTLKRAVRAAERWWFKEGRKG